MVMMFEFVANPVMAMWEGLPEDVRKGLYSTLAFSLPLSILGAISGILYSFSGVIFSRFQHATMRYCQTSIIFESTDKYYESLVDYIGGACEVQTGELRVSTNPRGGLSFQDKFAEWLGGKTKTPDLYFQPMIPPFQWKML